MAFPQVSSGDTQSGSEGSDVSTHVLTYPTNLANGDLILGLLVTDALPTQTWPAGFAQLNGSWDAGAPWHRGNAWWLESDGTETGNFNVTTTTSDKSVWRVFRITAWHGTTAPEATNEATGNSAAPDPNSHSPSWGAEDTLWIACGLTGGSDVNWTVAPSNYTDLSSQNIGGGTGVSLGTAQRENNTAAEDPGAFTISSSVKWAAASIAIRPEANVDRFAQVTAFEFESPSDTAPRVAQVTAFELEVPNAPRFAQVTAFELEVPTAPRHARVTAFEFESPSDTAPREAQVTAFELEVPTAPRFAQVTAFELEVPTAPRFAQVTAFEFEVPTAPRFAQVTAFEFEVPTAPRFAQVTAFELEVPTAPRFAQVTAFELEVPDTAADRFAQVTAFELEVPNIAAPTAVTIGIETETTIPTTFVDNTGGLWPHHALIRAVGAGPWDNPGDVAAGGESYTFVGVACGKWEVTFQAFSPLDESALATFDTGQTCPRFAQVTAFELETPNAGAPRFAQVTAFEFEIPTAPRFAQVTAFEFEIPTAPRHARVTAFEFEVPTAPRFAQVTAFELEVPTAPRFAQVTAFEFEVPTAPRFAQVTAFELEIPTAPRFAKVTAFEFESPSDTAPRFAQVTAFELETPPDGTLRFAKVTAFELEVPTAPRFAKVTAFELETPPDGARFAQVTAFELEVEDTSLVAQTLSTYNQSGVWENMGWRRRW